MKRIEQSKQLIGSAKDIDKTHIYFNRDNNNIAPNDLPLNVLGINQSFKLPTVYNAQRNVLNGKTQLLTDQYSIDKRLISKEVSKAYYEIVYWKKMLINYTFLDSLYTSFDFVINRKYKLGESNYLEKLTSETKKKEVSLKLNQIRQSIEKSYIVLGQWMQSDTLYQVSEVDFEKLSLTALDTSEHPVLNYFDDAQNLSELELMLEQKKLLPEFNTSLFLGANAGGGKQTYSGFQLGVSMPIWMGAQKSRISAAKSGSAILEFEKNDYKMKLVARYRALLSDLRQYDEALNYYEDTGRKLSKETVFHAEKAFQNGEIDFLQYAQLLDNAKSIETNQLHNLYQYNMTVLEANYLIN